MKSPIAKLLKNLKRFAELTYDANEFKHKAIFPSPIFGEQFFLNIVQSNIDCSF